VFVIELSGRYTLAEVPALWRRVRAETERLRAGDRVCVDLSRAEQVDGAAVVVLDHARRELDERGVELVVRSSQPHVAALTRIYARSAGAAPGGGELEIGMLSRIGRGTVSFASELWAGLVFVGRVMRSLPRAARRPRSVAWRDIPLLVEHAGANAVPVVVIIDFLIGMVTAYEAALQLKRFGATLYVADLVGASIVRELGPLITAVLVTGRTGAAFAAELGTMSVSDEIDALRAAGVDPIRFLVIPRTVTLLVVTPLLTLLGDCAGMIGGMLLAGAAIGITVPEYVAETKTMVFAWDVLWGLLKSVVFAVTIGLIACQQGLRASGGAVGVGRRTTSAVVACLFALVLIDALFAPFFHEHHR
jgi:phospholipid/cholesterol/gamma-HCH transport system permease protein